MYSISMSVAINFSCSKHKTAMTRTTIKLSLTESQAIGNSEKIMSFKPEEIFVANSIVCATYKTSSVTALSKLGVGITIMKTLGCYQQNVIPKAEGDLLLIKMIRHKLCIWLGSICFIVCRFADSITVGHFQNYATL
ncbi:hypothetical protein D3C78_1092430 [compost metagenome]